MALKADTHFAVGGASVCPTLLREEEGVVFRREALELQEVPEGYISLFGVEGCGRKAGKFRVERRVMSGVETCVLPACDSCRCYIHCYGYPSKCTPIHTYTCTRAHSGYQPRSPSASVASLPGSISQITMTTAKPTSLMSSCRPAVSQRHVADRGSSASGGVGIGGGTLTTNMSPLDFFVMMRKGSSQGSTQSGKSTNSSGASRPSLGREGGREIGEGQGRLSEECCSEGKRQREEIVLTGNRCMLCVHCTLLCL